MKLGVIQPPSGADTAAALERAIREGISGARVQVQTGSPGHFTLTVTAGAFAGQSRVNAQRMVYRCIASLMKGADAPVHAIDSLRTLVPEGLSKSDA